jgi:hypothetical protein
MDSLGIPAALHPPVSLAVAKAVARVPEADAFPGGSVFEPKWDGPGFPSVRPGRLCGRGRARI